MVLSWADAGAQYGWLACNPSCPSVLLQSVARGAGGKVLSWASSKDACVKQDQAASGRVAQGRLQEQYFGPHGDTDTWQQLGVDLGLCMRRIRVLLWDLCLKRGIS